MRVGSIERNTKETKIKIELVLDSGGDREIQTGIGFFDHMLDLFGKHGFMDLNIKCDGDLNVDGHHTVEDVGICIGRAFNEALGDKRGLRRFGDIIMPMDEALVMVALDISGRPFLSFDANLVSGSIGGFDAQLTEEFFRAFAVSAGITLHIRVLNGNNLHHVVEAIFKGVAKALAEAVLIDPRNAGSLPSTKGIL